LNKRVVQPFNLTGQTGIDSQRGGISNQAVLDWKDLNPLSKALNGKYNPEDMMSIPTSVTRSMMTEATLVAVAA
jgi:hypothetical protein